MSIVKMKKLRVIAAAETRDALLRELLRLGCVELREQTDVLDDPKTLPLVRREYGNVQTARSEQRVYSDALRILDQFAPQKTPLLSAKPEISTDELLEDSGEAALRQSARELTFLSEKLKDLQNDETQQKLLIEALTPWRGCELPLDYAGTKHVGVLFGMLPADADMEAVCAALTAAAEETELFEVSADADARYVYVFYHRAVEDAALQALRENGFCVPGFGTASGLAADGIAEAEQYLKEIEKDRAATQERITAAAGNRETFRLCSDRAAARVECEEAVGCLLRTERSILLEGWAVAEKEPELTALLEDFGCAYEFCEPAEEEYPDVPVKLKNNRLTDGLNMVTNMYSLPQYGTVDPNPLMAPFFILFYGIMMADMGYGILMALIGGLILWKKRPDEGFMRYFAELMVEGGIATFIMGIFTGGFFGDAPKWIVQLLNPASTWQGLPALIDPLNDTVTVLIGAMILGFIHLNAGMVISFVMKLRKGEVVDALCSEAAMWVLFIGIGCTLLGFGGKIGLIVGLVAYVLGKMIPAKGVLGRIIAVFSGLYSDATGWFGDVLSYARLMALMLAGSVIAQVFNTLGAMPGNIVVFFIISILGNALNFGLNLLGCYVHDLRLQCLEFFNKFYVAGGRPFKPLAVRSKFINVTK